jgi:hypothetical protein
MTKLFIAIAALMLVVSDNAIAGEQGLPEPSQRPSQPPAQVSMNYHDWKSKFSANMVPSPVIAPSLHGWYFLFLFPRSQSFYYEISTASPLLIQGWYVKMGGRVSLSPRGMDCRIYFQEVVDDLSDQGYAYYRWRTTKPLITTAGNFVEFVSLEPEFWSTMTGERGDASPAATTGFQQALANPQSIGVRCDIETEYVGRDYDPFDLDPSFVINPDSSARILDTVTFTMDNFAVCDPFAKQENAACALRTPDYSRRNNKYGP